MVDVNILRIILLATLLSSAASTAVNYAAVVNNTNPTSIISLQTNTDVVHKIRVTVPAINGASNYTQLTVHLTPNNAVTLQSYLALYHLSDKDIAASQSDDLSYHLYHSYGANCPSRVRYTVLKY